MSRVPGASPSGMQTTELHRRVYHGDKAGIEQLLSTGGADLDAYDCEGYTPLMRAVRNADVDVVIVRLLLAHGARTDLPSQNHYLRGRSTMALALMGGEPAKVQALLKAGASLHYRDANGYDALLHAVHGRDIARDARLMDLLRLLIAHGVALNGVSSHKETALRVLSHVGRFDAVALLISSGAEAGALQWTPLMSAVALRSPQAVERLLDSGASLEERDCWSRTAWLIAIMTGDLTKARLLQRAGADVHARGHCGKPPLAYAIEGGHRQMLEWLVASGQDVEQSDDFGNTPLFTAVECDDFASARFLLEAGAQVDRKNHIPEPALRGAHSAALAKLLLDAGADPRELSQEGRRSLLGLPPDPDALQLEIPSDLFVRARTRRFGVRNPELMDEPFWVAMIRAGVSAYEATQRFSGPSSCGAAPVWCAQRFGQSLTFLPDGRIVQIGGEHEDSYDADFCIYNDVFVHEPGGGIRIYGYPEKVFPPTDFHTATLLAGHVYVIGSLGYWGRRRYGTTPVYRLNVQTFAFERVECSGPSPGWIYGHRARQVASDEIQIQGGTVLRQDGDKESRAANERTFVLNTKRKQWRSAGTP